MRLYIFLFIKMVDNRAVQMKDYNYSNIRCEFFRIFGYSANRGVARVWS